MQHVPGVDPNTVTRIAPVEKIGIRELAGLSKVDNDPVAFSGRKIKGGLSRWLRVGLRFIWIVGAALRVNAAVLVKKPEGIAATLIGVAAEIVYILFIYDYFFRPGTGSIGPPDRRWANLAARKAESSR
jgi:hypothetical protein